MSRLAGTVIYKMSGSGNDFVFVDGRVSPRTFWTPELIREVCARHRGVGADGFVVLEPGSRSGTVRLHYFNADGAGAALCGNASLCAARLARRLELVSEETILLETDSGPIRARCLPEPGEAAEISLPDVAPMTRPPIGLEAGESWARFVQVGVPHLVILVEDLPQVPVPSRGKALRFAESLGTAGANVDFVAPAGAQWSVRTYERGVEAETQACGTGAVAVSAVLSAEGLASLPVTIRTASGCTLTVRGALETDGQVRDVTLEGEGRLVFRAVLGS